MTDKKIELSENLRKRIDYSINQSYNTKSLRDHINNSIIAIENKDHDEYTTEDYRFLIIFRMFLNNLRGLNEF